jgi:excisionase family DNA binding protein
MTENLLTISEVANLLRVAEKTIRNKLSDGTWPIPPVRIGRSLRWRRSDIERVMAGEIVIPATVGGADEP